MGRPKQWYNTQPGYTTQGPWGWDNDRLWSKIDQTPDVNGCHNWLGAMSPSGALMGVYKNDHQQMTQARRLVWMSINKEDVSPYSVTLKCGNQSCCNPEHFEIKKNNRERQL
jgi:hypothetical protein